MEPIFDEHGRVVAWFATRGFVLDRAGDCRAFVVNGVVFSAERRPLCAFESGYFWDTDGKAMAFVTGARQEVGPRLPVTRVPPTRPSQPRLPVPPQAPLGTMSSLRSRSWSTRTMEALLQDTTMPLVPERRRKRLGAAYRACAIP